MTIDIDKLFIQACHESMAQMSAQWFSRYRHELDWRGKAANPCAGMAIQLLCHLPLRNIRAVSSPVCKLAR